MIARIKRNNGAGDDFGGGEVAGYGDRLAGNCHVVFRDGESIGSVVDEFAVTAGGWDDAVVDERSGLIKDGEGDKVSVELECWTIAF